MEDNYEHYQNTIMKKEFTKTERKVKLNLYQSKSIVEATPMNKLDYYNYKGYEIPEGFEPLVEGYLVKKKEEEIFFWLNKEEFEKSFKQLK